MKIMQVTVSLDVTNLEHVEALNNFARALGGLPFETVIAPVENHSIPNIFEKKLQEESDEDRKKRERKERAAKRASEAAAAAEAASLEEDEEDDDDDDDPLGEEEEEITTALLRKLTADKIKENESNKAKVKAELTKHGSSNVTSLPEAKFAAYHKFIKSL